MKQVRANMLGRASPKHLIGVEVWEDEALIFTLPED